MGAQAVQYPQTEVIIRSGDPRKAFMYLAYLDDSGTRDKTKTFQVMTCVLMQDAVFLESEVLMGAAIDGLVPVDRLEKFEEFHAFELFGGYGIFEGVEQAKRFARIEAILGMVTRLKMPIIYAAVNAAKLQSSVYG
jgi:hypothetical protein